MRNRPGLMEGAAMSIAKRLAPIKEFLLSGEQWQAIACRFKLSGRELEIARYLLEDEKESTIARRLGISTYTVHTYVRRLYAKLVVSTRVKVIVIIFRKYIAHTAQPTVLPCTAELFLGKLAAA